jgi:long-chain acyl-CoA synthetase
MATATREAITADGWLRTGDLGRFDAEGFLYVTGRVKELFKLSNGRYVAPAVLEERLQLSSLISQCVVFGDGQPHVVALVVVDREALAVWAHDHGVSRVTADALRDPRTREAFESELAEYGRTFKSYERIRGFFLASEPLTTENGMLTPTLKVKRRRVFERYAAELQTLQDDIESGRARTSLGAPARPTVDV